MSLNGLYPSTFVSSSVFYDTGGGVYNVKAAKYGAKGDGVTDDTTAIQACINDSALVPGSTVYFPGGTYLVSATIQLNASSAYVGADGGQQMFTIIKQKNGSNLAAVVASKEWVNNFTSSSGTTGSPLRIEHLQIDANSANNTGTAGVGALTLTNFGVYVNDVQVTNAAQTAIMLTDTGADGTTTISNTANENRILNCKVKIAGEYGIWVKQTNAAGKLTDGYLQGNIIDTPAKEGIRHDRCAGWWINDNHVYHCSTSGYFLTNCFDAFIYCNEVDNFGVDQTLSAAAGTIYGMKIQIQSGRSCVIFGNTVATNTEPTGTTIHCFEFNNLGTAGNTTQEVIFGNTVLGLGAVGSIGFQFNNPGGGTHSPIAYGNSIIGTATDSQFNSTTAVNSRSYGGDRWDQSAVFADAVNITFGTTTGTKLGTGTSQKLAFYNSTPVIKPTVSGAKGSNAALGSLMTALAALGLVVDSTTA
jgi:hypothetical protein